MGLIRRNARIAVAGVIGLATLAHGAPVGAGVVNARVASGSIGTHAGVAATSSMLLWGSDADLARDLDNIASTGAQWLRFDFDWASAQPAPGVFDWSLIDRVVNAARARGL